MIIVLLAAVATGCYQERPSERPPIHLNPNMDNQPKYRPQAESEFFADGSTMRMPVPGTVARGDLNENAAWFTGKDEKGNFVKSIPDSVLLTIQMLQRGQERYNIYCSPCHSRTGDGRGIVVTRGFVPPPTFHSERVRELPDGQIFDVISNGVRNMPSYGYQVPVDDRWAIVGYLRALQKSHDSRIEDIPEEMRERIK